MRRSAIPALLLLLAFPAASPPAAADAGLRSPHAGSRDPAAVAARLPLHFEENRGQFDPSARFLARSRGFRAYLRDDEAVFVLPIPRPRDRDAFPRERPSWSGADSVRMRVAGAAPAARAAGRLPLPGRSNYLLGPDRSKWVRGAPHFREVRQSGVRPGVDLRWKGSAGGRLEYDLLAAPGADADGFALAFEGHDSIAIDARGDLVLTTEHGVLRHRAPVAWEEAGGRRRPVRARWSLRADGTAGFDLGPRDRRNRLVVDPVVEFTTLHGGGADDELAGLAAGPAGTIFVVGTTASADFPLVDPLDDALEVHSDAFVTKFNSTGTALAFSTYYGGFTPDVGWGIAVDAFGRATVVGETEGGIPVVNAIQGLAQGSADGFCMRLDFDGQDLSHSTYLGGVGYDALYCVAIDSFGNAWIAGTTGSPNLPVYFAVQEVNWGAYDVMLAKLGEAYRDVKQCTYIGSVGDDSAFGIAVDPDDSVLVTGFSGDVDFLVLNAIQPEISGVAGVDAFLYKASEDGFVEFSTYLGGQEDDDGTAVETDAEGRIVVAGVTASSDFPVLGALQAQKDAGRDVFLAKVQAGGGALESSTFLGGSGDETPISIAVDGAGWTLVGGRTTSPDFPVVDALQDEYAGNTDGFVCRVDPECTRLSWSTYLGGTGYEQVNAVRRGTGGRFLLAGFTDSADFPVVAPIQAEIDGGFDGFVALLQGPPESPAGFDARIALGAIGVCSWQYHGSPLVPVRVERKPLGGAWATVATVPPLVTQYDDVGIEFSSTYLYRAIAVGAAGDSEPTPEVQVTTPSANSVVPLWPSPISALAETPHRVRVDWTDRALNESHFLVYRGLSTASLGFVGTAPADADGYTDGAALPDRDYIYRARAANGVGLSTFSGDALVSTPATLIVGLETGRAADTGVAGRESVRLAGTFAWDAGAEATAFDPATQGFSIRFGDFADAPLFSIAPGDPGWRARRGKFVWRSPKGSPSRARVVLNPERGTWSFRLARGSVAFPSGSPVRVSLEIGADAGHDEGPWTPLRTPGKWRHP